MSFFSRACVCAAAAAVAAFAALAVCGEAAPVKGTHANLERYLPPAPPRKGPMGADAVTMKKSNARRKEALVKNIAAGKNGEALKKFLESMDEVSDAAGGADAEENAEIAAIGMTMEKTAEAADAAEVKKEGEEAKKEDEEIEKEVAVIAMTAAKDDPEAAAAAPSAAAPASVSKMAAEAKKLGSMLVKLRASFGSVAVMARKLGKETKHFKMEAHAGVAAAEAQLAKERELAALADMLFSKFSETVSQAAGGVTAMAEKSSSYKPE